MHELDDGAYDKPDGRVHAQLAEERAAFTGDVVKFAIWAGLALAFVFPLGVLMLIFGAPKRIRRFHRLYLEPYADLRAKPRRRRRRSRRGAGQQERVEVREPSAAETLHLADVVEAALAELGPRLVRNDIDVERSFDGPGELTGCAAELRDAATRLFSLAIDGIERTGGSSKHLFIELGENLAGNAVWLRVRASGTPDDEGTLEALAGVERIVSPHGGTLESSADVGGIESVVTLPKAASRPRSRGPSRSQHV
jgi:hypothetical protein